jgi:hypothetical protein
MEPTTATKTVEAPKPQYLDEVFEVEVNSKDEPIRFTEQQVSLYDYHKVWTVVEGDGGCVHDVELQPGDDIPEDYDAPCDCPENQWYALPGYHVVNRLHYVVSLKPWEDGKTYPIYLAP